MAYIPIDIEEALKRECRRRRYSDKTIKTYLYCINRFLKFTEKELGKISKKDVREFLEHLDEKDLAGNTMNTYHMAIRFLFQDVLNKKIWIDIKYSKIPEKLPVVLTKEEVKKLFTTINNEKHRLMIQVMYSAGLRVSELINLKIKDLEIEKGYGFVRAGKGNKDRIFIIAQKIKRDLMEFIRNNKTNNLTGNAYLFKGRNGHISQRMIQVILNNAAEKAKITKNVHPHVLRHSFAKHLEFNGSSPFTIQALLGHSDLRTTMRYLHTSVPVIGVKSPIDSL